MNLKHFSRAASAILICAGLVTAGTYIAGGLVSQGLLEWSITLVAIGVISSFTVSHDCCG